MNERSARAKEFEPELMERLGWLVMRWSFLEHLVSDLFCWLVDGNPAPMTIVTANVSASTLLTWSRTLVENRGDDPKLASEIRELLVAIDEVRPERNAIVHGLWGTSAIPGSAIVQTIRLERNPTIKEEVVTAADLDHLILETIDLIAQLRELLMRLGVKV
jgi:hypothetical protein